MKSFRRLLMVAILPIGLLFGGPVEDVSANQANVFIYHRFGDNRYPSTNTSTEDFRAHLEELKRREAHVVPLGEVVRRLKAGEPLPPRTVVLTVDDGFSTFLANGMPLLEEFGYPATLFVSTQFVGQPGYLSWAEIRNLQKRGIEIGNHSHSHPHLVQREKGESPEAWRERIQRDLETSRVLFKKHLGSQPDMIAYPYGEQTPAVQDIIRNMGFSAGIGQQSGVVGPGSSLFNLPRFPMGGPYARLKSFRSKLKMAPMEVKVLSPANPILEEGPPPELKLAIDRSTLSGAFNCFVQGRNTCRVEKLDGEAGAYRVVAAHPLSGRRNKYTLTARGKDGRWYWFSYQWIQPRLSEY